MALVLREARQDVGWSQNELAWRSGLSQQYIGYLEKELRSPSAETLKRLAMAFDRDLWSIIAEAEEKISKSGEEN
ncbi:MAG: helix-turn-helix transcriptional regulator [Akkermansiaceae bacterium]|nr:helix-turn-helix transcriptional regulator [Akkermansiaceae bacterium]